MYTRTLFSAFLALVIAAPVCAQTLLYEQPSTFASSEGLLVDNTQGWVYSENVTVAANDGLDGYLADDFSIPAGETWEISEIAVLGYYFRPAGAIEKASAFNVIVWENNSTAGTPGDELFRADGLTPTVDNTGDNGITGIISFTLASPLSLETGTYWVTVQADMATEDNVNDTHYYWGSHSALVGEPLQWWNYGGGLSGAGVCNQGWGDNSPDCRNPDDNNDPSVFFRLQGTVISSAEERAESQTVSILPPRPNPSSVGAIIPFALRSPSDVRLSVFDALGREVALVADQAYPAGEHTARFDTADLAPGTYVVRLMAGADVVLRTLSVAR